MKITLESTSALVKVQSSLGSGAIVEARIWEGQTESGIPVQAMICQLAVPTAERQDEFVAELKESHRPPQMQRAWDLRYFID